MATYPHLHGSPTPRETLKKFLEDFKPELPLHMICDAAFTSVEIMSFMKEKGVLATMSSSESENPKLWDILKRNVTQGKTKCFYHPATQVLTTVCGGEKEIVIEGEEGAVSQKKSLHHHKILTNAFQPMQYLDNERAAIFTLKSQKYENEQLKMTKSDKFVVKIYQNPSNSSNFPPESQQTSVLPPTQANPSNAQESAENSEPLPCNLILQRENSAMTLPLQAETVQNIQTSANEPQSHNNLTETAATSHNGQPQVSIVESTAVSSAGSSENGVLNPNSSQNNLESANSQISITSQSSGLSVKSSRQEIVTYLSNVQNVIPRNISFFTKKLVIKELQTVYQKRGITTTKKKRPELQEELLQKLQALIPQADARVSVTISEESTSEEIITFLQNSKNVVPPNVADLLQSLQLKHLKAICQIRGIAYAGLKIDALKKHILKHLDPTQAEKEILDTFHTMEESSRVVFDASEQDPHAIYRNDFNATDLFDRQFYNGLRKFKVMEWKVMIVQNLMSLGLINAWTIYHEIKKPTDPDLQFKLFKRNLIIRLLNSEDKKQYLRTFNTEDFADQKEKILKKMKEQEEKWANNKKLKMLNATQSIQT